MDDIQDPVGQEIIEEVDYKSKVKELQTRLEAETRAKQELLVETKKNKSERDAARAAEQQAKEDEYKKNGKFEELLTQYEDKYKEQEKRITEMQSRSKRDKLDSKSMQLASDIASSAANAKILSRFLKDEFEAMSDDDGHISDDMADVIKRKFMNDNLFASLVAGNKSNGGGALGSQSSTKAENTLSREDYNNMSLVAKDKFFSSGGKLTD